MGSWEGGELGRCEVGRLGSWEGGNLGRWEGGKLKKFRGRGHIWGGRIPIVYSIWNYAGF